MVLIKNNPKIFGFFIKKILEIIKNKNSNKIMFIKSWNEWGEGNYLEPDIKFGKKYLDVLKRELKNK